MRNGSQTFHEGVTQYILEDICREFDLIYKNQKIFFNYPHKKWYIVDFAIYGIKLILEIDGFSHTYKKQQQYDKKRSEFLNSLGWDVVRINNETVEKQGYRKILKKIIKTSYLNAIKEGKTIIHKTQKIEEDKKIALARIKNKQKKAKKKKSKKQTTKPTTQIKTQTIILRKKHI